MYPYDSAKLLVIERSSKRSSDSNFAEITGFLRTDDLLVFNDSKVVPARLFGRFAKSARQIEVLLIRAQADPSIWLAMGKPLKKFSAGALLEFGDLVRARVLERCGDYEVLLEFFCVDASLELREQMRVAACMPIPPYIRGGRGDAQDRSDYQNCFARAEGSIAAPTAGLHFTPQLLEKIRVHGCQIEFVTLHVGQASFLPLLSDQASGQVLAPLPEEFESSLELREKILQAKRSGRRIIAIGTTAVRALESMAQGNLAGGMTDLFIRPPYKFCWVDAIVTNFHQPGSTHLALVEAFLGKELLSQAYQHALQSEYRFLSYGDGMLLL